jgi:GTP-binding protein
MDGSDPLDNYRTIRRELEAFSPLLAAKREIIAANKMDLSTDDSAVDALRAALPDRQVIALSGASRRGVDDLMERLWDILRYTTSNGSESIVADG